MRYPFALICLLGAFLTACSTIVPEWSKPSILYGKDYRKAADELPQTEDYVPVSEVPDRPATQPDLSHVYEELADKPSDDAPETKHGKTNDSPPAP